ncbi:MAG: cell division protein ZapA [Bacteriovoracaceae bacterium]|nr:cell division protein ZapA [Bacteriovoracaceae bacterium]
MLNEMNFKDGLEFNILGCRVKFNSGADGSIDPKQVVDLVQKEVEQLKKSGVKRSDSDMAVLVALKLASDKIILESEYRNNIEKLECSVSDALKKIEQTSPATIL